jgi:hypothetical protein
LRIACRGAFLTIEKRHHARTILFDIRDEVVEQILFFGGHTVDLGGQISSGERGCFDDFADAFFVDCLDSLLCGIDFVTQLPDFRGIEWVGGALDCAVALRAQLLDESARVRIE